MSPKTIDEVIVRLDEIIAWAISNNSRLGYFAALYKRMTIGVKQGIAAGAFEDSVRMEQLDVIFANRYLDAFDAFQNNNAMSSCWKKAFEACSNKSVLVIQHLLLGISAHINFDLGIATAATANGVNIELLKKDFDCINSAIGNLVNEVQDELSAVNKTMTWIDKICNDKDEAVANFSIGIARREAWRCATELSALPLAEHNRYNANTDSTIAFLAGKIIKPGFRTEILLWMIKLFEQQEVRKTIYILNRETTSK